MVFDQYVAGQKYRWKIIKKLGEGDAGEVYLVESTIRSKQAILKRPRADGYTSDVLRQAAQIRNEASILTQLNSLSLSQKSGVGRPPALIDQSLPEAGYGDKFFIILERSTGIDLKSLNQVVHQGLIDNQQAGDEPGLYDFISILPRTGVLPAPILIRSLLGVIHLFYMIHNRLDAEDVSAGAGIIWNDVKPEHLFWDPISASLMVIDWGNSQFLEADGITRDRLYSYKSDCLQFIQEFGNFLEGANSELFEGLNWPKADTPNSPIGERMQVLKDQLEELWIESQRELADLRQEEDALYDISRPELSLLEKYTEITHRLALFGEVVSASQALNLHARVAMQAAADRDLSAFQQVCQAAAVLPGTGDQKWRLLDKIAGIAMAQTATPDEDLIRVFARSLEAGIVDDWPGCLWEIFTWIGRRQLPKWWDVLAREVRQVYLNMSSEALLPYTAVTRLFYTLQSDLAKLRDKPSRTPESKELSLVGQLEMREQLLSAYSEEVMKKWREVDPAPPDSGIGYSEISGVLERVDLLMPNTRSDILKVLAQPMAQAAIALQAWEQRDFDQARRVLRLMLVWDPDRRRLLLADSALGRALDWLARVHHGAEAEEPFYDYLTAIELAGRNLRNQVGPADWLDMILDAFKRLRKGSRPADLLMDYPLIIKEIPWLNEYRSREVLSLPRTRALTVERDQLVPGFDLGLDGVTDGKLSTGGDLYLAESLDTWTPEARGSSARVFRGFLKNAAGRQRDFALKVMRPDRIEYALPLFREELQVLTLLRGVPGITPLVECGFLRLDDGLELPSEESAQSAGSLHGRVIRYPIEEGQNFLASMPRYLGDGWLPYLALVRRSQENNLMVFCDTGRTHGWFLPLSESLLLAIQICDILQIAHDRSIVYRDHKILHYYWDPDAHAVMMIDWNVARLIPEGISDAERRFDIVQFGARALHHILTGRPAPGALPLGPNRPEEIDGASRSYSVQWTYDDERLPYHVKEILEKVLENGYATIRELRQDLLQVYQQAAAGEGEITGVA